MNHEPKEARRASFRLGETGEAHANSSEILLNTLLIVYNATTVGELNKWAQAVRAERTAAIELKESWQPLESWGKNASKLFEPMLKAVPPNRSWSTAELTAIAAAMRAAT